MSLSVVEDPHREGLGEVVLPSHEARETVLKYYIFYEINTTPIVTKEKFNK
jgi:hypothetical protein